MTNKVNVGEYGQYIRFNVNSDISAATLTLELGPANSTMITKTVLDGLSVPIVDISIDDCTDYLANEYAEYLVESGLFTTQGTWVVRLIAEWSAPNKLLKTDWQKFTINP